jgi:hypothetical protein
MPKKLAEVEMRSFLRWRTNHQYGTWRMPHNRFRHTAEHEPPHAFMPSGAKKNNVSVPIGGAIDDRLADVATFDKRVYLKARGSKLLRMFVDQGARLFYQVVQFWGVPTRHLRRSGKYDWRQDLHNSHLRSLRLKEICHALDRFFRVFRLVDRKKDSHCSS